MGKAGGLFINLVINTFKFRKGISNSKKDLSSFQKSVQNITKSLAGAFAVKEIFNFGKESSMLAGKLEGVEAAFNNLNDPNLLSNLRRATKGTVSDLELMQQAVKAKNLGLPVKKLGTFFEFARRRAKETGESVEFLANSIVNGIGRKSPLILDNLGISATRLREEFKKTGDFGKAAANIIESELGNMVEDVDTSAEATARFASEMQNFKSGLGEEFLTGLTNSFANIGAAMLKAINPARDISDEYFEMKSATESLESSMNPLISRYDELTSKSSLSKDEQNELKEIIGKVAAEIPSAVTEFNKYGEAIGISSTFAKQFIEDQKSMLRIKNAEAIQSTTKRLLELKEQMSLIKGTLEGTGDGYKNLIREGNKLFRREITGGKNAKVVLKEIEGGVDKYSQKLKKLSAEARGQGLIFKELRGEQVKGKDVVDQVNEETTELTEAQKKAALAARNLTLNLEALKDVKLGEYFGNTKEALKQLQDTVDKKKLFLPILVRPEIDQASENNITGAMVERGAAAGKAFGEALEGAIMISVSGIGTAIGTALAGGDMSNVGMSMLQGMSGLLQQFGSQMVALGIGMEALQKSLVLGPLGAGLAIAGGFALIAAGAAIKANLQQQSTGFANGGLVVGSVFGNVGEGRETSRSNPELIMPVDRLNKYLGKNQNGGMGGEVVFRIQGQELVGILNRQQKLNKFS